MSFILKKYLSREYFSLKAQGNSMFPLLLSDDIIFYKKTGFKEIKTNDLVLISKNKKYFTHRVIYKNGDYFVTKGDNNLKADGKISPSQLVGQVIKIKRNNQVRYPESQYLIQSTLYFQEIINIKKAFEKEKINFVFLKGLPIHLYFEKNHPRRIYLDCDILINKDKFKKLEKLLLDFGYKPIDVSLSNMHNTLRKKTIEKSFCKIINDFLVIFDIHLEIDWMSPQLGKLEAFYQQKLINQLTKEFLINKEIVKVNGENYPILSDKDLIIYLALHFFHHNFGGAFRLEFLDTITKKILKRKTAIDQVANLINKFQLQNFTYPSFVLLKKYHQTPLPNSFLEAIKPNNPYSLGLGSKIYHLGSVFDDEPRIQAGITRFKNLFFLSPRPLWIKIMVFFNPQVAYSVVWTLLQRLSKKFSFLNHQSKKTITLTNQIADKNKILV